MVIRILITAIALFVILNAVKRLKQKTFTRTIFFVWSALWITGVVFVWIPTITDRIAGLLQVGRGADAILYLSLILIFYLFYRTAVRLEHAEHNITRLTRSIAIRDAKHRRP